MNHKWLIKPLYTALGYWLDAAVAVAAASADAAVVVVAAVKLKLLLLLLLLPHLARRVLIISFQKPAVSSQDYGRRGGSYKVKQASYNSLK